MILKIFQTMIICFSIFSLMLLCMDFFLNKVNNLRRFHIGRWASEQKWADAVKKRAYHWLKHTPTVKKTDNRHYVLMDILFGKYRDDTIQIWQMSGLALGIYGVHDEESERLIGRWKKQILTENGDLKKNINKVDVGMLGYVLLKITDEPKTIKPAMEQIMRVLESNLCADGMISYSQGNKSSIRFVDTLGMVCPFLALYGITYHEKKYIEMALEQIRLFRKKGLFFKTSLPCHAFDAEKEMPLSIYGWGRGTAWYILSMLDTWKELPDTKEKDILKEWIYDAAEEYKNYQRDDGGYDTILQGGGQYDSSVTAVMSYFYKKCTQIFDIPQYAEISQRCLKKIVRVTMKNGAVDQCQGDTHGIANFSDTFDIMPFIQGMVLRTIYEKDNI